MRQWSRWTGYLLACLVPFLAGCEVVSETPTASLGEGPSVPTRTVKPIVSFTPRFTATPIPSLTPTPSDTPTPTHTLVPPTLTETPTPTPTPTVDGVIRSTQNVNLREGPGTEFPIIVSISPGTRLGVMSIATDSRGLGWYEVAYQPDEGPEQRLWVQANLLVTDYQDIVGQPPSGTTPTPGTRTPAPTPEPNTINILAYCRQKGLIPPRPTTNDTVVVWWSWFVSRPEYMDPHLENATYTVSLDGRELANWQDYASEIRQEGGLWFVYWYYPVGKLGAGTHEVTYQLTWVDAITDGFERFGPGTANPINEGSCTFTVVEP